MTSQRIFSAAIRTMWMVQAPINIPPLACVSYPMRGHSLHPRKGRKYFQYNNIIFQHTFSIDPVRIEVRKSGLIAQLLYWLLRFLIYLKDATRPPSPRRLGVSHAEIGTTPCRGVRTGVVGDGAGNEDWGRHFGGI